ncbi:Acyl-CoA dehydrogenase, C-terminal [Janibacter sp. HTCC2649]|uniref:acyl-CoA dehydrogenase family protein n=1 Tax=Janibacter sp. HTCC2649 TaxID=313589 RepID=UPI000067093A|nr:acyl-CoA dehydrogenase family protein [Janibacter sp. HTCC2649]EAQ00585.1 Acyl-CoA dehydrogenase, C-terminal [Janibacter sp. HTCC2649]
MSTPQQADPEFVALVTEVLRKHRPDPTRESGVLDRDFWTLLEGLGLSRLTGGEASGGSGANWYDAAFLHEQVAAHGLQLPLAEHDLLACWLLEELGLDLPGGLTTLGHVGADGAAHAVPWAAVADQILLLRGQGQGPRHLQVVTPGEVSLDPGRNLAGETRDTISGLDTLNSRRFEVGTDLVEALRHRASLIRAIQVCGALDAAVSATVDFASERVQFGRSLAQFQAVQHRLADAAAEAALARAATRAALDEAVATQFTGGGLTVSIAAARSCAGHASSVVVRAAHQLHGAIGTTQEHALHLLTVPAMAWVNEYGTVGEFDTVLTRAALSAEAAATNSPTDLTSAAAGGVWSLISDQTASAPSGH